MNKQQELIMLSDLEYQKRLVDMNAKLIVNLSARIRGVRELHKPVKSLGGFGPEACKGCSDLTSLALGYENWVAIEFCSTIKALDGEQS